MSMHTRSLPSHIRSQSGAASQSQSPALLARIEEKRAELDHLKELRELSAAVAQQMEALEQKLSTLSDGTEAIATVVSNWHNVLQAINMASTKLAKPPTVTNEHTSEDRPGGDTPGQLPQTLVRIPTEHAPTLHAQAEATRTIGTEDEV